MISKMRGRRILAGSPLALLGIFFLVSLLAPSGRAHDDENEYHDPLQWKRVKVSWSAPTYGTPVDFYRLQVIEVGFNIETWESFIDTFIHTDIADTFHYVWVMGGNEYFARVAGVDAQDRQGPWSNWTSEFEEGGYSPDIDYSGFDQ